jgi:hypothetical protein
MFGSHRRIFSGFFGDEENPPWRQTTQTLPARLEISLVDLLASYQWTKLPAGENDEIKKDLQTFSISFRTKQQTKKRRRLELFTVPVGGTVPVGWCVITRKEVQQTIFHTVIKGPSHIASLDWHSYSPFTRWDEHWDFVIWAPSWP